MFYCSTGLSITSDVFVHIKWVIFLSWCFFYCFFLSFWSSRKNLFPETSGNPLDWNIKYAWSVRRRLTLVCPVCMQKVTSNHVQRKQKKPLFTSASLFATGNECFTISRGLKRDNKINLANLDSCIAFPPYYSLTVTNLATLVKLKKLFLTSEFFSSQFFSARFFKHVWIFHCCC